MSSTHAAECPLGASIKDNCQTDSLEYVVLDIDEKETLQLRSGCDASVHSPKDCALLLLKWLGFIMNSTLYLGKTSVQLVVARC